MLDRVRAESHRLLRCPSGLSPTFRSIEEIVHEKRAHSRVQVRIDVSCTTEEGAVVEGVTRDLAVGGAFIESADMPAFGSKVKLALKLPGGEPLHVSAIVRWTKPGGFGVQFQLLGAKETWALAKLSSGK